MRCSDCIKGGDILYCHGCVAGRNYTLIFHGAIVVYCVNTELILLL